MAFDAPLNPGTTTEGAQPGNAWTNELPYLGPLRPAEMTESKDLVQTAEAAGATAKAFTPSASEACVVAMDKLFKAGQKMTPEIKEMFEQAIKDADAGRHNKTDQYKKELADLEKKRDELVTQKDKDELAKRQAEYVKIIGGLPEETQEKIWACLRERNRQQTADDLKKFDEELARLSPEAAKAIHHYLAYANPLFFAGKKLDSEISDKKGQIECEVEARTVTRQLYGMALLQALDKPAALEQFEAAVKIDPKLLDRRGFQHFVRAAGGDPDAWRKKYVVAP